MNETFATAIAIHADPSEVWATLTTFDLMNQWMGEPDMNVQVSTDWETGSPIYIRGFHHANFEKTKGSFLHMKQKKD